MRLQAGRVIALIWLRNGSRCDLMRGTFILITGGATARDAGCRHSPSSSLAATGSTVGCSEIIISPVSSRKLQLTLIESSGKSPSELSGVWDSCLFCAAIGSQWPLSYPPDQSAAWTHGSIKTSLLVLHACTSSMLPRDSVLSFHYFSQLLQ